MNIEFYMKKINRNGAKNAKKRFNLELKIKNII